MFGFVVRIKDTNAQCLADSEFSTDTWNNDFSWGMVVWLN